MKDSQRDFGLVVDDQPDSKPERRQSSRAEPLDGGGRRNFFPRHRRERRRAVTEQLKAMLPQDLPGSPRVLLRTEHCISRKNIDSDALKVMRRLLNCGYQAFLVGGAVRDLLLGKVPKDYDVGTNACPEEVRTLFRNSRIIGRRFRIIHVYFRANKIIELSTFRASSAGDEEADEGAIKSDNTYGDPRTDAVRRDLTINGLFYDLKTFSVIDYVGGIDDLNRRTIRIIGSPAERIKEDPVRMIRALRHAARTGFEIEGATYQAICEGHELIRVCPISRIYEEFLRDLRGGSSKEAIRLLFQTGLLAHLLPFLHLSLSRDFDAVWSKLSCSLERADEALLSGADIPNAALFLSLVIGRLPEDCWEKLGYEDLARFFVAASTQGFSIAPPEPSAKEICDEKTEDAEPEENSDSANRWTRRSRVSNMVKLLGRIFETLGVPRRERERMEHLLLAREALLAAACGKYEQHRLHQTRDKELRTFLYLIEEEWLWDKVKQVGPKGQKKRKRRRKRRYPVNYYVRSQSVGNLTGAEFKFLLLATAKIYRTSLVGAFLAVLANWRVLFAHLGCLLIIWPLTVIASFFGSLIGGLLMGFALALVLSQYFFTVSGAVSKDRLRLGEVWRGSFVLFSPIISVLFFLFLLNLASEFFFQGDSRFWLKAVSNLLVAVLLNAVPEIIYFKPSGVMEMMSEAFEFIQENFVEWFFPFAVLLLPPLILAPKALSPLVIGVLITNPFDLMQRFFVTFGNPWLILGSGVQIIIVLFVAYFLFVFRGLLFQQLSSSSRRKRIYQQRFS